MARTENTPLLIDTSAAAAADDSQLHQSADNDSRPSLVPASPRPISSTSSFPNYNSTGHNHAEEDIEDLTDPAKRPKVSMAAILPSLMIGVFMAAMDNLIIASAYGRIGSDLKELSKTSWLASAYLVTTTSFQPLYGKLSDLFGRKACLIFAYLVFALGSAWCGFAGSMNELIVARAFAGIGGGGMTTLVSILMSDILPLHKRGTWQGIINIVYATGAATGAPLGGILSDGIGWRWAFWIQVPFTLLAALLVSVFLNIPRPHHQEYHERPRTTWQNFKRVDFSGAIVLILAVTTFLIALDRGGSISWTDTAVLATLPTSFALFLFFGYIEKAIASDPFAPLRIVFEPGLLACFLCNLFAFGSFYAVLFYIPLYFQAVASLTASQSGLRMLPAIGGSVSGSLSGGIIMQKTGKYYILTIAAYSFSIIGAILVTLTTGWFGRSYTAIEIGSAIMGFGNGIGVTSTLIGLIARSGAKDQAVSTAVSYLFRSLGSVVGISIASTLLQGALRLDLKRRLKGLVGKDEVKEIVRRVTESLEYLGELKPEIRVKVVEAYEVAVRYPFLMAILFATLAAISSLFIKEQPLKNKVRALEESESDSPVDAIPEEEEPEEETQRDCDTTGV